MVITHQPEVGFIVKVYFHTGESLIFPGCHSDRDHFAWNSPIDGTVCFVGRIPFDETAMDPDPGSPRCGDRRVRRHNRVTPMCISFIPDDRKISSRKESVAI